MWKKEREKVKLKLKVKSTNIQQNIDADSGKHLTDSAVHKEYRTQSTIYIYIQTTFTKWMYVHTCVCMLIRTNFTQRLWKWKAPLEHTYKHTVVCEHI